MARTLSFDEVKTRLLAAARGAGLSPFDERSLLDLDRLDRTFGFSVVPLAEADGEDPARHAEVTVHYPASYASLDEPEEELDLEIDVEYSLVPEEGVELARLEAVSRPLLETLNATLGGTPRPIYYTVATDYRGGDRAVKARVLDLVVTSALEEDFDATFLGLVARALERLGTTV